MKHVITHDISETNGSKNRCLSCGTTENIGRRRYCSTECRKRLHYKLEVRTGLVRALNTKYATFYFSENIIVMDMLPYGSHDIYSFFYPRSPGKKPAEDFGHMADLLGDLWWAEKRRTNKRYIASHHVLEQAFRNKVPILSVKPIMIKVPSIRKTSLTDLDINQYVLTSPDLQKIVKNAYRRQAKEHHPDLGGDAIKFRRIYQAYEELTSWSKNPTFTKRSGFPDKWFYDGNTNRWIQPLPLRKTGEEAYLRISW
jgi:hypothetical protein